MGPEMPHSDDQSSTELSSHDPDRTEDLAQEYFRIVAGKRDEEQ